MPAVRGLEFAAGFLLALVREAELKDAVDAGCAAAVTALSRPRANC
jgi:sugar/nucleoside kinase (ribokinase family)